MRFCGPSNLNGQVPVVHSGTQEFYIGDEGEEEAGIVVLFGFFGIFSFLWIVVRIEAQQMRNKCLEQSFQLVQVIVLSSFVTIRLAKTKKQLPSSKRSEVCV